MLISITNTKLTAKANRAHKIAICFIFAKLLMITCQCCKKTLSNISTGPRGSFIQLKTMNNRQSFFERTLFNFKSLANN